MYVVSNQGIFALHFLGWLEVVIPSICFASYVPVMTASIILKYSSLKRGLPFSKYMRWLPPVPGKSHHLGVTTGAG